MLPHLWLRSVCKKNGLLISDEQLQRLEKFVSLLLQENKTINLLSRKDVQNIWENHILYSVSPLFLFSLDHNSFFLDLGTGGGLPGIPLKILLPKLNFTLLDSIQKKVRAVQRIVYELSLEDIEIVCARAEDLPKKKERRAVFDLVIARAVTSLKKLVEWSFPLLKPSTKDIVLSYREKTIIPPGTLLAFKGGDIGKEIEEAKQNKKVKSIHEIPLVFHGSGTLSLTDKKIVLVQFTS